MTERTYDIEKGLKWYEVRELQADSPVKFWLQDSVPTKTFEVHCHVGDAMPKNPPGCDGTICERVTAGETAGAKRAVIGGGKKDQKVYLGTNETFDEKLLPVHYELNDNA